MRPFQFFATTFLLLSGTTMASPHGAWPIQLREAQKLCCHCEGVRPTCELIKLDAVCNGNPLEIDCDHNRIKPRSVSGRRVRRRSEGWSVDFSPTASKL